MTQPYASFRIKGDAVSCLRYGNGHINETYLVKTDAGIDYILQKINHGVFRDVPRLMANIAGVTRHLAAKDPDPRHVLTLVRTLSDEDYLHDDSGYWRLYDFITDSICLDRVETVADCLHSGAAFGRFQNQLADYRAETLFETIGHFHDTPARYQQFIAALDRNILDRSKHAREEIAFAKARQTDAAVMTDMQKAGKLPLRVTHNDAKLNNVMLDAKTRRALCVIDLDTVMPGLSGNDFGDAIRFGASTAAEDEKDLSRVSMSLELYRAFAGGFLGACKDNLTQTEIDTLPLAAKLMTFECGLRFLADYLAGDTYFHTDYPDHNLDRCRTQFKLVADMEDKFVQMQSIIHEEASK